MQVLQTFLFTVLITVGSSFKWRQEPKQPKPQRTFGRWSSIPEPEPEEKSPFEWFSNAAEEMKEPLNAKLEHYENNVLPSVVKSIQVKAAQAEAEASAIKAHAQELVENGVKQVPVVKNEVSRRLIAAKEQFENDPDVLAFKEDLENFSEDIENIRPAVSEALEKERQKIQQFLDQREKIVQNMAEKIEAINQKAKARVNEINKEAREISEKVRTDAHAKACLFAEKLPKDKFPDFLEKFNCAETNGSGIPEPVPSEVTPEPAKAPAPEPVVKPKPPTRGRYNGRNRGRNNNRRRPE